MDHSQVLMKVDQFHFEVPFTGWFFRFSDGRHELVVTLSQLLFIGDCLYRIVVDLVYLNEHPFVGEAWAETPTVAPPLANLIGYPPFMPHVEFHYACMLDRSRIVLHFPGVPDDE